MRAARVLLPHFAIVLLSGLAFASTGCDQLFDIEDGVPLAGDGAIDGTVLDDAGLDAVSPPEAGQDADPTIRGTWIHHHVTDNGLADDYIDFTKTPIAACVPNAAVDGGADCYAGTGTALGAFTITGVPTGATYYVRAGSTWFYAQTRTIDLSDYVLGRIDAQQLDAGSDPSLSTIIALDTTAAAAWAPGDTLELVSTNAGVTVQGLEQLVGATNLPDAGDTALGIRGPWVNTLSLTNGSLKLVDATHQDQTYLLQLARQDAGAPGSTYQVLTRMMTTSSFTTLPYATSTLSGAFQSPSGSVVASLIWHHDEFRQHATELHPRATSVYELLTFDVVRGDGSYGWFFATPDLLVYELPNGNTGNESLSLQAPNPFPPSASKNGGWTPYVGPFVGFTVNEQLPLGDGGTQAFPMTGFFSCLTDLHTLQNAPDLVPAVAPVRLPQIASRDFFQDQTNVGVTPTISWQRGSFGAAPVRYTLYVVEIRPGPTYTVVATLATTGTSLTLPPGIMQPGRYYVMQIGSFWTSVPGAESTPFQVPIPNCSTLNVSGVFTP